jgi:RNA polymerase sigma-70 factor (ECF subfamily)
VRDALVQADAERLKGVYEEHGAKLWRAVYLSTGDREVASDAVAEAFAQALHRGSDLHAPERWVWRSAFRIAAGELKRQKERQQEQTNREVASRMDAGDEIPDVTVELLMALPHLSPKQRAAVVLHHHSGYSLKEVAEIIGSTPAAVGVHLYRGRKRLRELLGDDDA